MWFGVFLLIVFVLGWPIVVIAVCTSGMSGSPKSMVLTRGALAAILISISGAYGVYLIASSHGH